MIGYALHAITVASSPQSAILWVLVVGIIMCSVVRYLFDKQH